MEGVSKVYNISVGESIEKGVAKLSSINIDEKEARSTNLGLMMSGVGRYFMVNSGDYMRLDVNGELMMSDTDMEKYSNFEFVRNAHGEVMIAGLGIGLILNALRDKVKSGEVTSIVVYEKYQDVIDLILPYYKDLPIEVRCEDILSYKPSKDEKYDTIYFDIWPVISTDNLDDIKLLHNRWKFRKLPGGWMNSWMKEFLQSRKREEREEARVWRWNW